MDLQTKQPRYHIPFIILIAISIMFLGLGDARLWDRDEPRNAGCAEEMMTRGDVITPIFNNELRGQKPALLYWLIISAYQTFGVSEFSARFWSAVLGCGTVLLTYLNGRRMFNPQVGFWAAIVLSSSLMFVVAGRAATPDSLLIFCVTAAMTIFIHATFSKQGIGTQSSSTEEHLGSADDLEIDEDTEAQLTFNRAGFPQSWWKAIVLYIAMGFAVLAKGPVGLILPVAIIGMYLLIVRLPKTAGQHKQGFVKRFLHAAGRTFHPKHFLPTCWAMRPFTAVLVVLAVAAPWYIWVGFKTDGDFLRIFFLREHFGRATIAMENHRGNVLYYPIAILVGSFPWSVFTVPLVLTIWRQMKKNDPWRNGYVFAICWVAVWVGAFTIAKTKLPSYVTPCYPAIALLMGCFLHRWIERPTDLPSYVYRIALGCFASVGLLIAIALPIATTEFIGGEKWLLFVGVIPFVGGLLAILLHWKQQYQKSLYLFAAASILFSLSFFGVAAGVIGRHQESPELFEVVREQRETNVVPPVIGAFGCMRANWPFYSKAPVYKLVQDSEQNSEQGSKIIEMRSKNWKPLPALDPNTFISRFENAFLLTPESNLEQLREHVDCELTEVCRVDLFLEKGETLVLLKPIASE